MVFAAQGTAPLDFLNSTHVSAALFSRGDKEGR